MRLLMSVLVFILVASCGTLFAAPKDKFQIGLEGGMWLAGGDVSVDDDSTETYINLQKESSMMFRGFADLYALKYFQPGIFVNYVPNITYQDSKIEQTMFEFGLSAKFKIPLSEKMCIRPGLGLGRRSFSSDTEAADNVIGLGANLSCEFQYEITPSFALILEAGFLSQPLGGNTDYSVTFPPIWYLAAGIGF